MSGDAELRARLNAELGFYPASLDEKSIAEYRRKAAEDGDIPGSGDLGFLGLRTEKAEVSEDEEIEARKKKAERGWLVEPERPRVGYSPVEEIETWFAVIGLRPYGAYAAARRHETSKGAQ